jgi:hypothetical protein
MPITGFTVYPTRDMAKVDFDPAADTFVEEMAQFVTDANALETNVNAKEASATSSASAASVSAASASSSASSAAASALTAVNAPGTSATSTTNLSTGSGSKSLTIQTGKSLQAGQFVIIAYTNDVSVYMIGQITSYNSGTGALVVNVLALGASGTNLATWVISLCTDITKVTASGRPLVVSGNTLALAGYSYFLTASLTLTLPASPTPGDTVAFRNLSGALACVIARNGSNIMGSANDMTLDDVNAHGCLLYVDATRGWQLV